MSDYILSCGSTADMTRAYFESRKISVILYHFTLDGTEYPDDFGETMSFADFYSRMAEGAEPRTSLINISRYLDYFCTLLAQGQDVLHVAFSGGLSGAYQSAVNAANIARERYPDRKIFVVDSLAASSGYGLLMDKLADLRDAGQTIEQVRDYAEENRLCLHHWFFSTDLTSYIRGGRVSRTAGLVGNVLGICPLLWMDAEGMLIPRAKIRGKKKVITEIVNRMKEHAQDGTEYNGKVFLSHSACIEDAQAVASLVEATFPHMDGNVVINSIGTTVGSHAGPGTVAMYFWGDKRTKA